MNVRNTKKSDKVFDDSYLSELRAIKPKSLYSEGLSPNFRIPNLKLNVMDTNLSLFNQINSLSYWLLLKSNYKSTVKLNADEDIYFITIKKGTEILYTSEISNFSKKNKRYLQFELTAIVNHLLHIKDNLPLLRFKSA